MKAKQLTEGSSLFLDLVRAISVQMVVVGHGISFCSIALFLHPPDFPWIQNIAVVIFFILSGYLISNSVFYKLSTDTNYSFRSYFIDRFSRIYSAFIPALLFIFLLDFISVKVAPTSYNYFNAFDVQTFIGNIFMLQDFPFLKYLHIKITSFGSARPLWTLAIEWWIYLWFGLLAIKILKEKKISVFTTIAFVFLCVVPAYNFITGRGNGLTLFWLFGVLIGLFYDRYKSYQLPKSIKAIILVVLIALACIRVGSTMEEYDILFALILSICLLIGMELCSNWKANKRIATFIKWIASYSYTLYLIHFTIYDCMLVHLKDSMNSHAVFWLGFIISNLLSLVIGYYTEIKLTKWIKEKMKSRFLGKPIKI